MHGRRSRPAQRDGGGEVGARPLRDDGRDEGHVPVVVIKEADALGMEDRGGRGSAEGREWWET